MRIVANRTRRELFNDVSAVEREAIVVENARPALAVAAVRISGRRFGDLVAGPVFAREHEFKARVGRAKNCTAFG